MTTDLTPDELFNEGSEHMNDMPIRPKHVTVVFRLDGLGGVEATVDGVEIWGLTPTLTEAATFATVDLLVRECTSWTAKP